jgi:CheY-like chemotaxis protein
MLGTSSSRNKTRRIPPMRAVIMVESKAMRSIVKRVLGECGYDDTVEVAGGFDPLGTLESLPVGDGNAPDLLLVDGDPHASSLEATIRALRTAPRWLTAAVVVLATEASIDSRRVVAAGADAVVAKPFTTTSLVEHVEAARRIGAGIS